LTASSLRQENPAPYHLINQLWGVFGDAVAYLLQACSFPENLLRGFGSDGPRGQTDEICGLTTRGPRDIEDATAARADWGTLPLIGAVVKGKSSGGRGVEKRTSTLADAFQALIRRPIYLEFGGLD